MTKTIHPFSVGSFQPPPKAPILDSSFSEDEEHALRHLLEGKTVKEVEYDGSVLWLKVDEAEIAVTCSQRGERRLLVEVYN